ncbi:MAG: hypothetical protein QOE22_318 [Candidatus Parcubacteria bacterium]|jgi:prepilin-type N-terminal cleavage/methylation domain-containing protein|nr:hypothetical protein [Candidatus Parcubacteria bacterium]
MSALSREKSKRAFTLIELLVVISIIGLLSSIVLASLNTARNKGRDAAIKLEMRELVNLFQSQYADTGSYGPLFSSGNASSWYGTVSECTSPVIPPTGTYATQQRDICAALLRNESNCGLGATQCLYINYAQAPLNTNNHFTVMAWLPGIQQYYCMGSSGSASVATTPWSNPGCWSNP